MQRRHSMHIALEKEWNLLRDVELDQMAQYQFMLPSPTWQISTFWTNNNHSILLRTLQVEVEDISVLGHPSMHLQLLLNMILSLWEVCHNHRTMLSPNTQSLKIKCLHLKCQTHKVRHRISIQKCRSLVVVSSLFLVCQWCHPNINQVLQQEVQLMISRLELMLWKMVAEEACDILALKSLNRNTHD